jgi:anti-sigma regulatory factor (Ser/Thr protein kinase)
MSTAFPDQLGLASGELVLAAQPVAVRGARRFAGTWLRSRQLTGLVHTVHLIVSELTTNSVKAAAARAAGALDGPARRAGGGGGLRKMTMVTLRLTLIGPSLFVIVLDEGPGAPSLRQPAELDEDGRGLALVASLARSWGHYPVGAGGKAVWAEVEVPGRGGGAGPAGKVTPLPRRVPGMFPAPRRMRALDDVGTLRRVLDGLRGLDDGLGAGGPGGPDGDLGGPGGGWPGGRDLA